MSTRAYHFVNGDTMRDGRKLPADGVTLVHDGEICICESGLHASRDPFDALQYAPGSTLCLVEVDEIADEQKDKLVARKRTIIRRIDATKLLRKFACDQAMSVAHLWEMPDVARQYFTTQTDELRAASWAASWAAASAAVRAAAWDAARDAVRASAWASARDAAGAAAGGAAEGAAAGGAAAGAATASAAVGAAAGAAAAWAAASAATAKASAWASARDAARKSFNSAVDEAFNP